MPLEEEFSLKISFPLQKRNVCNYIMHANLKKLLVSFSNSPTCFQVFSCFLKMTKKSLTVSARCVVDVDVNFWKSLSANGADGMQVEKGTCQLPWEFVSDRSKGVICDVAFCQVFFFDLWFFENTYISYIYIIYIYIIYIYIIYIHCFVDFFKPHLGTQCVRR